MGILNDIWSYLMGRKWHSLDVLQWKARRLERCYTLFSYSPCSSSISQLLPTTDEQNEEVLLVGEHLLIRLTETHVHWTFKSFIDRRKFRVHWNLIRAAWGLDISSRMIVNRSERSFVNVSSSRAHQLHWRTGTKPTSGTITMISNWYFPSDRIFH